METLELMDLKTKTSNMTPKQGTTPREVKINLSDYMGNNYRWTLKKDINGYYKINCHGQAFSNFQCKHFRDDIEWVADEGDWERVIRMINSGVKKVISIKSR